MAFPDSDLQVKVYAYMGADPNSSPSGWPPPVELTGRLLDREISVSRGRSQGQRTAAAGQCSFWLDNHDGALTPGVPTSPYYGRWDLGVPVALDVDGVGTSPPYGLVRGYVAEIRPEIIPTASGPTSVVKVTLGGILRRLGQGGVAHDSGRRFADPVISARVGRVSPQAYWPMSTPGALFGGRDVRAFYAGHELEWTSGELASWLAPGFVSDRREPLAFDLHDTGEDGGVATTIAAMDWVMRLEPPHEETNAALLGFALGLTGGAVALLTVEIDNGVPAVSLFDPGAPSIDDSVATNVFDGKLHAWRLEAENTGTNVVLRAYLDGQQILTASSGLADMTGVTGATFTPPNTDALVRYGFGQLIIWAGTPADVEDAHTALLGHPGETATARILRICAEEGIPHTPWSPAPSDDIRLGPQPVGTVLDVLRDAELAGHGILYESTDAWGLGYRPLESRYNQSAALTIDLSTYRVTGTGRETLQPVWNDQRLRNELSVRRPSGGEVRVQNAASIAKYGRYDDSVTVNVESDGDLVQDAMWRLHLLAGGVRYAAMPIDLGANPSLLSDWLDIRLGDRIDRTSHPLQHPAETVSVILEGYSMTLRRRSWTVDAIVEPYLPWHVGVYADDAATETSEPLSRYDTAGCVTASNFTAPSDTSLSVTTTSGPSWTTSPADWPFLIVAGGVVMRVNSVSGSGASQTLSVTVLSNVSKTIPSGTAVTLFRPAIYGL